MLQRIAKDTIYSARLGIFSTVSAIFLLDLVIALYAASKGRSFSKNLMITTLLFDRLVRDEKFPSEIVILAAILGAAAGTTHGVTKELYRFFFAGSNKKILQNTNPLDQGGNSTAPT